jgi:DNA processing protein
MAGSLARQAAQAGAVVVSGLARGIDSEAHEAALSCGGKTWAVLGSGLGRVYPPEHDGLARRIAESGGLVLSEYPTDASPLSGRFPRRNRIISGLCWATVVVEGTLRSGSLITARLACEQGRLVFAVPGPVESALSDAPNLLIRQGAGLISSLAEVWPELPPGVQEHLSLYDGDGPRVCSPASSKPILPEHRKILQCLGGESRSLDELCLELGIDFSRLSNIIFEMELRNLVMALPGQRYAKKGS